MPASLVVVGGGVIGLELGSVWARLGSKVTVVEYLDTILGGMDGEVAKQFQRMLAKQGIEFRLGSKVTGVAKAKKGASVTFEPVKGGAAETIQADVVLIATGRRPFTDNAGLAEAGVALDERGRVKVDGHLQTNVPGIYAIGDVIAGPMLAHKAEDEGVAVAEIIAGQAGHVNYDVIPSVVYTSPEVASVGKTEEELKEAGHRLQGRQIPVHRQWPRPRHAAHRGLCENPCRPEDRPRARRAHRRLRRRRADPRSGGADGIRRLVRGPRAHLPRASDHVGGGQGSRTRDLLQADPHLITPAGEQKTARREAGRFCVAKNYCAGAGAGAGWAGAGSAGAGAGSAGAVPCGAGAAWSAGAAGAVASGGAGRSASRPAPARWSSLAFQPGARPFLWRPARRYRTRPPPG